MGDSKKRSYNRGKSNYSHYQKKKILVLEAGVQGFFCTCNFQEKNCIREAYNLLNEYADKMYGPQVQEGQSEDLKQDKQEAKDEESEDISDVLEKQISDMKTSGNKFNRFQSLMTSVPNCIFIKSTIKDSPVKLGHAIVEDIAKTKSQKTRYLLRLVPIEATCGVKLPDIINTAGQLFDKYFLSEPTTFSIVFNRRYNNSISRDDVIKELADLITSKNSSHKANLTNPKYSVIVEVIKGVCLLSVLPDYYLLKKYNVVELCVNKEETKKETEQVDGDAEELATPKISEDLSSNVPQEAETAVQ